MTKTIEFEDALDTLITETFKTKKELKDAITYFKNTDLSEILERNLQWYD